MWAERSLAEALVLDGYSPDEKDFTQQVHADLTTPPPYITHAPDASP